MEVKMRRHVQIRIREKIDLLNEIYAKMTPYTDKIDITGSMLTVEMYEDTEGYGILVDWLQKRNIEYAFAESREYTKDEIRQAKFFNIAVIYPWEADGVTADEYGTQYSSNSACKKCGIGRKQISDLIIEKRKMGKYDIATITPEIIINERLLNLICDNDLTGYEFKPVKDVKGKEKPDLYQLVINNILPQMSNEIKTVTDKTSFCDECKMHGVFLRSEIVYESDALKNAKDFNLSYEYFGARIYCNRQIIVSNKVYDLFTNNKVKRVAFEPVRIV
ncbi:MAG: hypothetical protein AAGU27_23995 [Dehalobacterium sp.]